MKTKRSSARRRRGFFSAFCGRRRGLVAEAESARSDSTVVELMSTFPIADFVLMFDVVFGDRGGA